MKQKRKIIENKKQSFNMKTVIKKIKLCNKCEFANRRGTITNNTQKNMYIN